MELPLTEMEKTGKSSFGVEDRELCFEYGISEMPLNYVSEKLDIRVLALGFGLGGPRLSA